eukprot:6181944-Pleurochrysis_carterae.AAC.2
MLQQTLFASLITHDGLVSRSRRYPFAAPSFAHAIPSRRSWSNSLQRPPGAFKSFLLGLADSAATLPTSSWIN